MSKNDDIRLKRVAKGKRPIVFDDPTVDHLMTMMLEMATELYAVYQRLDTVERMLADAKVFNRDAVEAYQPDEQGEAERLAWRELFLERLFRTIRADRG